MLRKSLNSPQKKNKKQFGDTCFSVLVKRTSFPVSEGCCSRTPGYDNDIVSIGTSL